MKKLAIKIFNFHPRIPNFSQITNSEKRPDNCVFFLKNLRWYFGWFCVWKRRLNVWEGIWISVSLDRFAQVTQPPFCLHIMVNINNNRKAVCILAMAYGQFFCRGGGGKPFAPKNSCKLLKFFQNSRKETRSIRCNIDTVFQGQYLPILSINYVAIKKLPPQLYQIKMKNCHDQACNDIGVVIAMKWPHYLLYLQQYFSLGTVLTKSFTEALILQ